MARLGDSDGRDRMRRRAEVFGTRLAGQREPAQGELVTNLMPLFFITPLTGPMGASKKKWGFVSSDFNGYAGWARN